MKKISLFWTILGTILGAASVLTSCNSKPSTGSTPNSVSTSVGTSTSISTSISKVTNVKITNDITKYFVGDSVQINTKVTTSGDNADTSLVYKTSDSKVATVSTSGLVNFLSVGSVEISVSSATDNKIGDKITFEVSKKVPTEIKINKNFTSGRVGDEVEFNYVVTPVECKDDVKVEISNPQVLEIKDNKIKLLKEGSSTISVVSKADANVKDELTIKVLKAAPQSITISNTKTSYYVGDSFELDYTILPSDAEENVTITVDHDDIVSIEGKKVNVLKGGTVTIKISSLAKEEIFDTFTINAINPDFLINKDGYTKNVDYTHMDDKGEAYLQTATVSDTDNPHAFAMFNASGTKYYAEATVSMIGSSNDGWARFGIGSATDDSDGNARAFFFSPKEGQKIVMMDVPNGWGAITAQSMIWQANGINTMDPTNLKLGILRDGDNYYYLLNDKLYWFETNTKFHDVNTYPTIVAKDTQINIADWSVTLDNAQIAAKLDLPTMKQVFFNADTNGRVNFESDSKFSISGGDTFQNAAVKPIGDKALLKGNFAIEFDLSNVGSDNANDNNNRIGVALRQVGIESPYISDSFAMTNNGAEAFDYRIFKWNGGGHTYWETQNEATRASGATVEGHYKIVRTINGNSASLLLYFNNAEVLNVTTSYIGDYHPIFGANYASGTFNNVTFYGIE